MVKHLIETDKKKNIMRPTISHNIKLVTENVAVFPAEKEAWTKTMIRAANLKIKITRKTTKLLLLQKLREKGIGVNEVEEYAKKEVRRGAGGGERFKERRRKEIVRWLMKNKVKSAEVELEEAKRQFYKENNYLRRRWFQH